MISLHQSEELDLKSRIRWLVSDANHIGWMFERDNINMDTKYLTNLEQLIQKIKYSIDAHQA